MGLLDLIAEKTASSEQNNEVASLFTDAERSKTPKLKKSAEEEQAARKTANKVD